MDSVDRQIVDSLQKNGKISMKELAEQVHMSPPSVIERVRKLEERGMLTGYHASVSYKALNRPIQALILFKTTDCRALAIFCQQHPDVLECHRVAGEISYIVKLATHSVETLELFIDETMAFGAPSTNIILSSYESESIDYYQEES